MGRSKKGNARESSPRYSTKEELREKAKAAPRAKPVNEKGRVPRLRFPQFQMLPGWSSEYLGSSFSERIESDFPALPLLSLTDKDGIIPQAESNRRDNSNSDKSKYLRVCPGDIAYNTMRMWEGRSALSEIEGLVSPAYTICKPSSQVLSLFYAYYFKTQPLIGLFRKYSQGLVKDTLNLGFNDFSKIKVPSPTINEQKKIAACLSALDKLISAHTRKLEALKKYKRGLMQQLFPVEGEAVPRLRFPEFSNERDWLRANFGTACSFIRGPFGGSLKKEIFVDKGYVVYEQSHAIYGKFDTFRYFITNSKYKELKRFAVKGNDIIMSCSGTMGRFAIIPHDAPCGVINQALLKLTVKDGVDTQFLIALLSFPPNLSKILSQSAGGAIQNVVSVDQMKEIEFLIPPLPEQRKIASALSSLDDLIAAQAAKIEELKEHKRGLMQGLFPEPEEDA